MRRWLETQREAGQNLSRVTFIEETERVIDSPFGVQRVQMRARLSGAPAQPGGWEREILALRLNGREVPPARWEQLRRRQRGLLDRPEVLQRDLLLPPRLLARLRPTSPVTLVRPDDGGAAWRFDAVPRQEHPVIEQVTLWFDQQDGRLRRSRIVARPPQSEAPFVITTEYDHVQDLDVPRRRHVEGTMQMRRRLRTFTLLFTLEAAYRDYRFDFGE